MYENTFEDIEKAQKGDKEVLASLVKNNMGLVYNIVKRFVGRGYELEDLNQIGTIGLIKAIKQFDSRFNVKLSTYSVPYIMGEIKRFIRDDGAVKVSRSIKELSTKIRQLQKEYVVKEGRDIKIDEISKILKIPKEDIALALDATSNNVVSSIDEPIGGDGDDKVCVGDILANKENVENTITNRITVEKLIEELNQKEKNIVILRYFKNKTQTEVAKELGISQVQVSRIEKKILCSMRENLREGEE